MSIGTAPYQHGGMRSASHLAFEKLKRKCGLRAALLMITAEIDAAVAGLSQPELLKLQNLMADDVPGLMSMSLSFASKSKRRRRL